jgi:hypothetical protein
MRTASVDVSSATLRLARTPGVVVLARDLKILSSRLIRVAKRLSKH